MVCLRRRKVILTEYFWNDRYKILNCIFKRQILVSEGKITKISQEEIGKIVNLSKVKVNNIINELKEDGYLEKTYAKGKYIITKKGIAELNELGLRGLTNEN